MSRSMTALAYEPFAAREKPAAVSGDDKFFVRFNRKRTDANSLCGNALGIGCVGHRIKPNPEKSEAFADQGAD